MIFTNGTYTSSQDGVFDANFGGHQSLALYFCRHGHLWVEDTTTWADNAQFSEVEDWFFKRAEGVFGRA